MQMRSRKQRQPGRRSRSRRSLKGGAQAYKYEGVNLSVGNPFIQIAVTQEDNRTYSFNVPGAASFKSYCDIVRYYQANVPLACVNPTFINSGGKHMKVPSLVQILGLALLLQNEKVRLESSQLSLHPIENVKPCIDALNVVANDSSSRSLFDETSGRCIVSNSFTTIAKYTTEGKTKVDALRNYAFYKVSELSEDDVKSILKYFKIAMFCYKFFPTYPTQNLDTLQFEDFFKTSPQDPQTTKFMKTFVVNATAFDQAVDTDSYKSFKVSFYTPANLSASAANASAASVAPSAASAASLAPSPSSSVDVDARLAVLETAVAKIQQSVAEIQRKLA